MKKRKIALKTFLFTSLLTTLLIVLAMTALYFIMPKFYLDQKLKNLEKIADSFVSDFYEDSSSEALMRAEQKLFVDHNVNMLLFDDEGLVPTTSDDPNGMFGFFSIIVEGSMSSSLVGKDINGNDLLISEKIEVIEEPPSYYVAEAPFTDIKLEAMGFISTERELDNVKYSKALFTSAVQPIDESKDVILKLMPFILLFGIVLTLIASFIYSRYLTNPIVKLANTANEMQKMQPDITSGIRSNDEIGELSTNLDSLYKTLHNTIYELRQEIEKNSSLERSKADFMRATSHELKTPITALSCILDGMIDNVGKYKDRDKYLVESRVQIDKLSVLVNQILNTITFEEVYDTSNYEDTDIYDLLYSVISDYKNLSYNRKISINCKSFNFIKPTNIGAIKTVFSNLISNAIKYAPADSTININFESLENKSALIFENECIGISNEDLPKLTEPFYTMDYSRNKDNSGNGLGLYIVKQNLERLDLGFAIELVDKKLRFIITWHDSETV